MRSFKDQCAPFCAKPRVSFPPTGPCASQTDMLLKPATTRTAAWLGLLGLLVSCSRAQLDLGKLPDIPGLPEQPPDPPSGAGSQASAAGTNAPCASDCLPNWRGGEPLESLGGDALTPHVAMDGSGNAMVVWRQRTDGLETIYAARLDREAGFEEPLRVGGGDGQLVIQPLVAMNSSGGATVVWRNGQGQLLANHYWPDRGWSRAQVVVADAGPHTAPAMDDEGNAMVLWRRSSVDVWCNRASPEGDWSAPQSVGTPVNPFAGPVPTIASPARLAMRPNGDALALWLQQGDPVSQPGIWSHRYTPQDEWGEPATQVSRTQQASGLALAMGSAGNALAIWTQPLPDRNSNVWASFHPAGARIELPQLVELGNGFASSPDAIMVGPGVGLAVWDHLDDSGRQKVWSNRYDPQTGRWAAPQRLDLGDQDATAPQLGSDGQGSAVVVFQVSDPAQTARYALHASTYRHPEGFGPPVVVEPDAWTSSDPSLAMDRSGTAVVVWVRAEGNRTSLWATRLH